MEEKTFKAVIDIACDNVVIVQTEQEALSIKNALVRVATSAIKETEMQDCEDLEDFQDKYLQTLEDGAEKEAVKKAFETVLADFSEDKEHY